MAGYTSPAPWWIRQHQPLRASFCSPAVWIGWKLSPGVPPAPEEQRGGSKNVPQWYDEPVERVGKVMYVRPKRPYFKIQDVEMEIDGKSYDLEPYISPSEFMRSSPDVIRAIDRAVRELGISRRRATRALFKKIVQEREKVEKLKESVFNDDEEIITILVATDDI